MCVKHFDPAKKMSYRLSNSTIRPEINMTNSNGKAQATANNPLAVRVHHIDEGGVRSVEPSISVGHGESGVCGIQAGNTRSHSVDGGASSAGNVSAQAESDDVEAAQWSSSRDEKVNESTRQFSDGVRVRSRGIVSDIVSQLFPVHSDEVAIFMVEESCGQSVKQFVVLFAGLQCNTLIPSRINRTVGSSYPFIVHP